MCSALYSFSSRWGQFRLVAVIHEPGPDANCGGPQEVTHAQEFRRHPETRQGQRRRRDEAVRHRVEGLAGDRDRSSPTIRRRASRTAAPRSRSCSAPSRWRRRSRSRATTRRPPTRVSSPRRPRSASSTPISPRRATSRSKACSRRSRPRSNLRAQTRYTEPGHSAGLLFWRPGACERVLPFGSSIVRQPLPFSRRVSRPRFASRAPPRKVRAARDAGVLTDPRA